MKDLSSVNVVNEISKKYESYGKMLFIDNVDEYSRLVIKTMDKMS